MAKMAAANMYRVGDYVYFEANSTAPYQVRRIEELNKTNTGNVEAKVMCFFRRRDISSALLKTFDRCSKIAATNDTGQAKEEKVDVDGNASKGPDIEETPFIPGQEDLSTEQRHLLVHRELFLSRQIETLPATHIRGKCTVALLNEVETPDDYLKKEDAFFYSLIYDPNQKTLVADKGEIRVGENYQAVPPEFVGETASCAPRGDVMLYDTNRNLSDTKIDQYLVVARAIGTFARALDMVSAVKIPNLHASAAASVRDVTTQEAMNMLHSSGYDLASAILSFVPMPNRESSAVTDGKATPPASGLAVGGPVLARDQLEEWSAAEANLFEEALEKYGKDFNDIRNDFLPWKSLKNIVEYYYMYKTTDRYVQQKRAKAAEAESRLKQVYIPTYTKPNPNIINSNISVPSLSCESCKAASSEQWYAWGPSSAQLRLCKDCWSYWKRYGGLKRKHKYENFDRSSAPQIPESLPAAGQGSSKVNGRTGGEVMRWIRCAVAGCNKNFSTTQLLNQHLRRDHSANYANGIPSGGGRVANTSASTRQGIPPKTRSSIYLHTSVWTKVARRLAPKQLYNARHYARHPCEPINPMVIAQHCQTRPWKEIQNMAKLVARNPSTTSFVITPASATKSATHSAKRKAGAHTSGNLPVKRGRDHLTISDYRSWIKDGVKDCFMISNTRVMQLRQKMTPGQVHRLARNPFKETKLIATHVLSKTDSGGTMAEGND
uniref:Metastasis-associated protein MTA3 n=1 Tax=Trichuris muris TaxID=70415 RepID=A0A5S6R580_TRIMR